MTWNRASATGFSEGDVGIYGRLHTGLWSSLWHAQANTCMGRGKDRVFPHHLHDQNHVGVYLWPWECPHLNLAPHLADDGVGIRSSRDSCPAPLRPVMEGSSKICVPCVAQPSGWSPCQGIACACPHWERSWGLSQWKQEAGKVRIWECLSD